MLDSQEGIAAIPHFGVVCTAHDISLLEGGTVMCLLVQRICGSAKHGF